MKAPRKPRAPRPRAVSEASIGRQVASFLALALPSGTEWSHIPSGGSRHKATAGKLKAEGVRRGVPDYVIVVSGVGTIWIELKNSTGRLSPEQRAWSEAIRHTPGSFWALCRSVEDVQSALLSAGVPLRATIGPRPLI